MGHPVSCILDQRYENIEAVTILKGPHAARTASSMAGFSSDRGLRNQERIKAPMRDNAGGGRVMARHDPLPEQGAQEIAPRLPS
jgi:hypothetical protein